MSLDVKILSNATDGVSLSVECGGGDKVFEIVGNTKIVIQASIDNSTWVDISRHVVTSEDLIRRSDHYPWWRISILVVYSGTVDAWCLDTIPQRQHGTNTGEEEFGRLVATGDPVVDTGALNTAILLYQNTGNTLSLYGDFYFNEALATIQRFQLDIRYARLIGTLKNGLRITVGTEGKLLGYGSGQVLFPAVRRYRISSIASGVPTAGKITITLLQEDLDDEELGPHDFVAGDEVFIQNVVLTSASPGLNNTVNVDVASTTTTTVVVTCSASVDSTVTYPRMHLDGHGRSIYPVIYRSRTGTFADFAAHVQGTNPEVRGVEFKWAAAGGIIISNATGAIIEDNIIWETAADSIHFTNKSNNCSVRRNRIYRSGDDGIAVISYKKDAGRCHNISIENNTIRDAWFNARGITISGGHDINIAGNKIYDVYHAGILISDESANYGINDITIVDNTMKTTGGISAPTGWVVPGNASFQIGSGTNAEDRVYNITVRGNKIFNSRYRMLAVSDGANVDIDGLVGSECGSAGVLLEARNSRIKMSVDRCQQDALLLITSGGVGKNEIDINISNVNRGTRIYIESITVASEVITITIYPGQNHAALTNGTSVIIQGVTSGWNSVTDDAAEVRKDFAINGTWTLSSNVVSFVVTATGTGLDDTTHARVISPDRPCPQAYVCLASGDSSNQDGIEIDSDEITDKKVVIRANFGEQLWPMERTIDDGGAGTNTHKIDAIIDNMADDPIDGDSILYLPTPSIGTRVTTDADRTITAREIKRSLYIRESITAPRTDTLPTSAILVALFRGRTMSVGTAFEWRTVNLTANALTLALGASMTNSGSYSLVVAGNTEVVWGFNITNPTAGSEVVDISRRFTRSGISA